VKTKDRRTDMEKLKDALSVRVRRRAVRNLKALKVEDPQAYYDGLTAFEQSQGEPLDPLRARYRAAVVAQAVARRNAIDPMPAA
jgi:hypothetical protein